jgi:subtilase family serine protease
MVFFRLRTGSVAVAISIIASAAAYAASRQPVDLGRLADRAGDQAISVTIILKLRDQAGAEDMMRRVSTPTDPMYTRFMLPAQVQAQFGPSEETVAAVVASLRGHGLTVERTTATTLRATGTPAIMEQTFQTSLHQFQQAATDTAPAVTFHGPTTRPVVPDEIASAVGTVTGLSTKPVFHSNVRRAPDTLGNVHVGWSAVAGADNAPVGTPGYLTVLDLAARYNINPLYGQGIKGKGRTIGIVALASFTPGDAFAYWSSLNLNVDPNRLTVVNIDGGPGAPSDASGSGETTLDVEQSGGVAPDAKIIVYQAPNNVQAWVDAYAAAIQSNNADSISLSWVTWEGFANDVFVPPDVIDPFSGQVVTFAQAMHELFVEAALQGQSLFVGSGDLGAYQLAGAIENGVFGGGTFTVPLSVEYPAADTAITVGGGTTLPATLNFALPSGPLSINIPTERVWGWDYLEPLCAALQVDPITCGIFPTGGGGGVSVFARVPFYQLATAGVQTSQPGQVLSEVDTTPAQTLFVFPAHFPGRNLPDVSLNADPMTGYTVFYTSDVTGFAVLNRTGGTSFVGPQLAGITTLLAQNAGHRLGLLNPLLYWLASNGGTQGTNAALNTISAGDNWFYSGSNGYSPAAGLGTLNVANLANRIKQLAPPGLLTAQHQN